MRHRRETSSLVLLLCSSGLSSSLSRLSLRILMIILSSSQCSDSYCALLLTESRSARTCSFSHSLPSLSQGLKCIMHLDSHNCIHLNRFHTHSLHAPSVSRTCAPGIVDAKKKSRNNAFLFVQPAMVWTITFFRFPSSSISTAKLPLGESLAHKLR